MNCRSLDARRERRGTPAREARGGPEREATPPAPPPRHPARRPYLPSHPAPSGCTPTSYNRTPNPSLTERGLKRHQPLPACGHVTPRPLGHVTARGARGGSRGPAGSWSGAEGRKHPSGDAGWGPRCRTRARSAARMAGEWRGARAPPLRPPSPPGRAGRGDLGWGLGGGAWRGGLWDSWAGLLQSGLLFST